MSKDYVDPHPVEENPEEHVGEEILDPWSDPLQTDWPMNDDSVLDHDVDEGDEEVKS